MTGEGAPSQPAGFSLVFAGRGDPLVVWLSFQHSLARFDAAGRVKGPSLLDSPLNVKRNNGHC
jgi:hypothetical protein